MTDATVRFDERAERDLSAAVEWYDEQRDGLGDDLLEAVDDTIQRIAEHPRIYPEQLDGVRRALTDRFPFSIYYATDEEDVLVLAVLHNRRLSEELRGRLDD